MEKRKAIFANIEVLKSYGKASGDVIDLTKVENDKEEVSYNLSLFNSDNECIKSMDFVVLELANLEYARWCRD